MHTHALELCAHGGVVSPSQPGSAVPAVAGWHVPSLPHARHMPQAVPAGANSHEAPVLPQTWHAAHTSAQQILSPPLLPEAGSQWPWVHSESSLHALPSGSVIEPLLELLEELLLELLEELLLELLEELLLATLALLLEELPALPPMPPTPALAAALPPAPPPLLVEAVLELAALPPVPELDAWLPVLVALDELAVLPPVPPAPWSL